MKPTKYSIVEWGVVRGPHVFEWMFRWKGGGKSARRIKAKQRKEEEGEAIEFNV